MHRAKQIARRINGRGACRHRSLDQACTLGMQAISKVHYNSSHVNDYLPTQLANLVAHLLWNNIAL